MVNTLRPRQNGRHFPDNIFKCIFLNENVWISIKIPVKYVPKGPINNIPALFQIMAWRRPGDKPLSETMMVTLLTHICVTRPQWVNTSWVLNIMTPAIQRYFQVFNYHDYVCCMPQSSHETCKIVTWFEHENLKIRPRRTFKRFGIRTGKTWNLYSEHQLMSWTRKEPRHQQSWYWPCSPRKLQSQFHKGLRKHAWCLYKCVVKYMMMCHLSCLLEVPANIAGRMHENNLTCNIPDIHNLHNTVGVSYCLAIFNQPSSLTHCDQVTPHGIAEHGQHWYR